MTPYSPLIPGDPDRLGELELLGRLGEGGQGVVYLAVDSAGTHVAVKWLRHDQSDDSVSVGRFLREAEVARQVAQFCTAAVLGTGVEQGRPYIVSEFVDGPSLRETVRRDGPRTGSALDRLAVGTATALAAIHQGGIVHRDFKPANVILGADGPRVIDFGIARTLAATSTISDTPVGTPAYMAPEQILGDQVGPAADMFSWAGTMVFASCGRPPFGDGALPLVVNRVLTAQPELGSLDGPLRDMVESCLSKDPARRPTAEQVIKRLLGHPVPDASLLAWGVRHATTTGGPAADAGTRWPVVAGAAVAAVTVIALVAWAAIVFPGSGPGERAVTAREATPRVAVPDTPVKRTLPGGVTLYEYPSDPIALTAYEVYDKKLDDDVDYARQSLTGSFDKHPANWQSIVSPDGRYLAGRPQDYTSDGYDSILFNDRATGSSFRVKTVRKPLISTIRSWSRDGSRLLLNVDKKIKGKDGKDEWISLGFAIVNVAQGRASVVNVADESIRASDFGWDARGTGVIIEYGDEDGLRLFDTSGRPARDYPGVGTLSSGTKNMFSPSGKSFVTDCGKEAEGEHCVWDTAGGRRVRAFSSDCDKVLGWYDESHLYCWELDNNASHSEVQVVAFDGRLIRKLLEVPEELDFTPFYTVKPAGGS